MERREGRRKEIRQKTVEDEEKIKTAQPNRFFVVTSVPARASARY